MSTPPAPVLAHPVMSSAQGLLLILNAASLRRLPMPFHAAAVDWEPTVTFQFTHRSEVTTWAAALEVAEVEEQVTPDRTIDRTVFETTWHDVPIRCVASIPREPREVA